MTESFVNEELDASNWDNLKKYFDELKRSMDFLGSKKNTLFIGQAVEVPGTAMSNTLKSIKKKKL